MFLSFAWTFSNFKIQINCRTFAKKLTLIKKKKGHFSPLFSLIHLFGSKFCLVFFFLDNLAL